MRLVVKRCSARSKMVLWRVGATSISSASMTSPMNDSKIPSAYSGPYQVCSTTQNPRLRIRSYLPPPIGRGCETLCTFVRLPPTLQAPGGYCCCELLPYRFLCRSQYWISHFLLYEV